MSKKFKTLILTVVSAFIAVTLFGCAGVNVYRIDDADGYVYEGGYEIGGYEGGYGYKEMPSGYADAAEGMHGAAEGFDGGTTDKEQVVQTPAGRMTASAWDDNRYYDYFLSLFAAGTQAEDYASDETGDTAEDEPEIVVGKDYYGDGQATSSIEGRGRFYGFYNSDRWGFDATKRVKITVDADGSPVAGALVTYYGNGQSERYAVTDANGVAYIFPDGESGSFTVKSGSFESVGSYSESDRDKIVTLGGGTEKANVIKLMFVVDVTGSMGDEISYLTAELNDVVTRVVESNPQVMIDLAFLFYRDDGDAEKMKYYDFITVTSGDGLATAKKCIAEQRADGGGDTPEALDEALLAAALKDWGSENSTKVIFNVYDAPPHEKAVNKMRYEEAVRIAAKKGIRINPVLCSGADLLCEYLARQTAIHTQGNFVYVTDDSGIGGSHYDPDIPNAVVERLNDLIVRLICGYHSGTFAAPVEWRAVVSE